MQNCLEVIADAVLQVVLFQVEADHNESYLVNPDATPLVQGVMLLIDLAKKKAALWSETEQQQNQGKMIELCHELHQVTIKIAEFLEKLKSDAYDQATKEELLFAAKNCMVFTVHLMKLADLYDVYHIEKSGGYYKNEQKKFLATEPRLFQENLQNYVISSVNLGKEVVGRANYIVDSVMQERLNVFSSELEVNYFFTLHSCLISF